MIMIYNVNFATGKLEAIDATDKNDLPVGTVLHLNGYNNPDSVIVHNFGINHGFSGAEAYGAKYQTVSLEDFHYGQQDAHTLMWLRDKTSGKIQTYITEKVLTSEEVRELKAKADANQAAKDAYQVKAAAERLRLSEIGKALFLKHIPETAQALIVAERHKDESDMMTDYFSHTTTATVIIGYSMHKKDLFSEMRKAAARIPETEHLGPGRGHFEPRVIIGADFQSNGSYYSKGHGSHWHRELTQDETGKTIFFGTKEEAEKYIADKGTPETIGFDGIPIPFYWEIDEREIEHREKYSMGAGYYLKDGFSDSSGWCVSKQGKFRDRWDDGLFVSMGKRCIFEEAKRAAA